LSIKVKSSDTKKYQCRKKINVDKKVKGGNETSDPANNTKTNQLF